VRIVPSTAFVTRATGKRSRAATDRADSAERILTAARRLVLQQGARRLSLTDVAALAGVSRPTLYRYFPSKEDLIAALGKLEYRRINSAMENAISALSGRQRLEAAVDVVVHFLSEQPPRGLIDLDPGFVHDELTHVLPLITDALTAVLAKCAKEDDVALPAAPRDMASAIARIALSHYLFPDRDSRAARRQVRAAAGLSARQGE
jgi:AcrR family transcriptional regulator